MPEVKIRRSWLKMTVFFCENAAFSGFTFVEMKDRFNSGTSELKRYEDYILHWKPLESIKFLSNSQLTVNGAIGRIGQHVVSRVVVEHRVDPELVPIPRHNMEAKAAVEKKNKSAPATRPRAQVIDVRFILAYMFKYCSVAFI